MRFVRKRSTVVCRYLSFTDPRMKRSFRLPLVHIRMRLDGKSLRTIALVDSGSTDTFIPFELIESLGLETKLGKETDVMGANGVFKAHKTTIDKIEVLKSNDTFCDFNNIRVLVPGSGTLPYSILGRDSIFWQHDITFREHRQHIIFKPSKKEQKKSKF